MLAIGGKQLASYGKAVACEKTKEKGDGRRENDADWGTKTRTGTDGSGKTREKVTHRFGFKLHLIVDTKYELPVMYRLKKASESEQPAGLAMIKGMGNRLPEIACRARYMTGDRGYDDTEIIVESRDNTGIKPVIDIRNCRKDGEKSRYRAPIDAGRGVRKNQAERARVASKHLEVGSLISRSIAGTTREGTGVSSRL
jgi:hypothetical protein